MVWPATAAKYVDVSADAPTQPTPAPDEVAAWAAASRGVLDGAFAILETLAYVQGGLGLTDLARRSGLAKTSTYRIAEKLTALGAVQRVGNRYYIGARVGRLGRQWQPHPLLRQVAQAPVRALAARARGMAALRTLHNDQLWVICATVPRWYTCMPAPTCRESMAQTATGRVLYAADDATEIALLPDRLTAREWRQLRQSIRDLDATVVDHQEAFPGICCVSAPVWWPNGRCAGALTAQVQSATLPPRLPDLVWHTAGRISAALRQSGSGSVGSASLAPISLGACHGDRIG